MTAPAFSLLLADEDATIAFARCVGALMKAGDTLLLEGDIGAGKSFFARALIQSLQTVPEHVPSPTFTLVQTYDTTAGEIWHADLYRLGDTSELDELGLTDAFETAICLIEWPDRLGDNAPAHAALLHFELTHTEGERQVSLLSGAPDLLKRLSKMDEYV